MLSILSLRSLGRTTALLQTCPPSIIARPTIRQGAQFHGMAAIWRIEREGCGHMSADSLALISPYYYMRAVCGIPVSQRRYGIWNVGAV